MSSELRVLGCQFSHDFSSFRDLRWLFCYFHVPRARWVPHPTKFIPKQCSIQWASERYWFELSMRCKLWDICEKHTNIHTYIHDPSPFSIACWTSASRLRREVSVWTRTRSIQTTKDPQRSLRHRDGQNKTHDRTLTVHWPLKKRNRTHGLQRSIGQKIRTEWGKGPT